MTGSVRKTLFFLAIFGTIMVAIIILLPRIDPSTKTNEIKTFELTAGVSQWEVRTGSVFEIWGYNDRLPGPEIRVTEGDRARIIVKNNLPEATAIHWHGLDVPNNMDGVPHVTQELIEPGKSFTYEFTVRNKPGTYMYHSHHNVMEQISKGMYGLFIVEPAEQKRYDGEFTMMLSEAESHYLINGKSFPATEAWKVRQNGKYLIRMANISPEHSHPMHMHGHTMTVIAKDGRPTKSPYDITTINIAPGETYDIEFTADAEGGTWLFHCHILMHVSGPDPLSPDLAQAHAGMITVVQYDK